MDQKRLIPLPIVLGPTGSGKSDLALSLALALGGEIVSCDSLQVFRGLDIGTAKVRPADRQGIPHHLVDLIEPTQLFTAGDYARVARPCLRDIAERRRLPVVVGGTGFYLRALLEGLFPARSAARRSGSGCRAASSAGREVCIAFFLVSIRSPPPVFIQAIRIRPCAPWR